MNKDDFIKESSLSIFLEKGKNRYDDMFDNIEIIKLEDFSSDMEKIIQIISKTKIKNNPKKSFIIRNLRFDDPFYYKKIKQIIVNFNASISLTYPVVYNKDCLGTDLSRSVPIQLIYTSDIITTFNFEEMKYAHLKHRYSFETDTYLKIEEIETDLDYLLL